MSNLEIRQAGKGEIDSIAQLELLCFSSPWSRQAFEHDIGNNSLSRYYIVELDGIIIAYGGIWLIHPEGHITNIAVHPAHRRKGVGKELLRHIIETTEGEGITCHTLEVRISNEGALKLYRKAGFIECGQRKNYYEDTNEAAVIMWRDSSMFI